MTHDIHPDQLVLIREPRARHDNPVASRVAAGKVRSTHQGRLARIAGWVDDAGYQGMTADEIHARAVLEDGRAVRSTWHGATSAACREGLIVRRGPKDTRLSVNNSIMHIYITARWQR